jgi:(S)-2-hydroxy-acid oxidase
MERRTIVTVDDYESIARERLPAEVYDYYAGGAGDERTLAENRRAFERWVLRPRVLTGVSSADPSTRVLSNDVSLPILVAPWAYQRLAHPDGELATARAAARAGTVMVVSTTAVAFLEDVAAASDGPKWWQLYVFTDRGLTAEIASPSDRIGVQGRVFHGRFPRCRPSAPRRAKRFPDEDRIAAR